MEVMIIMLLVILRSRTRKEWLTAGKIYTIKVSA